MPFCEHFNPFVRESAALVGIHTSVTKFMTILQSHRKKTRPSLRDLIAESTVYDQW